MAPEQCPLCLEKGINSLVKLYQINMDQAVLNCENPECFYPIDGNNTDISPASYIVDRDISELVEDDLEAESETEESGAEESNNAEGGEVNEAELKDFLDLVDSLRFLGVEVYSDKYEGILKTYKGGGGTSPLDSIGPGDSVFDHTFTITNHKAQGVTLQPIADLNAASSSVAANKTSKDMKGSKPKDPMPGK